MKFIDINIADYKERLSKIDDPTIINIELALFCNDKVIVKDTTWLKNIESLVELINYLNNNLDRYIFEFIDNPISVEFVRHHDVVRYTIYTLDNVYECEIPILDLIRNVSSTIKTLLEVIVSNNKNLKNSPFINRLFERLGL